MEFTTLLPGHWSNDAVASLIGDTFDVNLPTRTVRGTVVSVGFAAGRAPTITIEVPVDATEVIPDGAVGLALCVDLDEPALSGGFTLPAGSLEVVS